MEIIEIEQPSDLTTSQSHSIIIGGSFSLLTFLETCDDETFEKILHEWAYSYLRGKYQKISRIGGPGDKGRDIIAYTDYKKNVWDNYQCKKYNHKLKVDEILLEIGKLCHRCHVGELPSPPQKYFFFSPLGVSPQVNDLLREPLKLKNELIEKWNRLCKNKIVQNRSIDLDSGLKNYINQFDFKIFDYIPPADFMEQYKTTSYCASRFGILSKSRPLQKSTPQDIQNNESVYIRKILDAYEEKLGKNLENSKNIVDPTLRADFERHRECFFSAESLNEFSRDTYAAGEQHFEKLKDEFYDGIINTIEDDAENGFVRLRKVLDRATELQITNNPLVRDLNMKDRKGICHHLANERDDVVWKK